MKKPILFVIAIVLLGVIGLGLWASAQPKSEYLHGEVEIREIRLSAKIAGRIHELHVREGEQVEMGQLLVTLDGPEIRARLQQAEAARDAAQALSDKANAGARDEEITMARLDWERAMVQAELAQSTLNRLQELFDEGLVSRQQFDEVRAQNQASQRQAEAAESRYLMAQSGARSEERRAGDAQARQAAAAVAEAEALESETRILSPINGEIAAINIRRGELAPAGAAVLTVIDPSDVWIVVNIREDYLRGLSVGQVYQAYVPALDETLSFKVSRLNPLPTFATWKQAANTPGYDLRTFQVEARPVSPDPRLRAGMSVIKEIRR